MSDDQPAVEAEIVSTPEVAPQSPSEVKAIATRAQSVVLGKRGIELENLQDLLNYARSMVRNNVAPKGMNEGQAAAAIQAGLERGMGLQGGLQACIVVNGVLSWRGWAAIGFIQNCGLVVPGTFKTFVEGNLKDGTARGVCVATRKGYAQSFVRTFSIEDAKRAGLWGKAGPWTTRPTNMLEWRAVGDMARFHFPEALGGVPIAEDVLAGGVGPQDGPGAAALPAGEPLRGQRFVGPGPAVSDPILGNLSVPVEPEVLEASAVTLALDQTTQEGGSEAATGTPAATSEPPDALPQEQRKTKRRSEKPPHPNLAGAVVEKREEERRAEPAAAVRPDKCPRCGGGEFDVFGTCPACNWPGAEPGA